MKKIISFFLCVILAFNVMSTAFAVETDETTNNCEDFEGVPSSLSNDDIDNIFDNSISYVETYSTKTNTYNSIVYGGTVYGTTFEETGAQLREHMKNRESLINVTYYAANKDLSIGEIIDAAYKTMDSAFAHTGVPNEGDYIYLNFKGWSCKYSTRVIGGSTYLTLKYTITYYSTAREEAMVDAAVAGIIADLDGASDYEKVKNIYDYIVSNVDYDFVHLNQGNYDRMYTSYAALIDGTAICQGFSQLFYRLALELGIPCRVVGGTSTTSGAAHCWNIVKLGDSYYYVDPTWGVTKGGYTYFLKSEEDFDGHERSPLYQKEEFVAAYPMATESFVPAQNISIILDGEDVSGMSGTMPLNGTIELSAEVSDDATVNDVAWSSSDESVATVVDGYVEMLDYGTATITAYALGGSDVYASYTVNTMPNIDDAITVSVEKTDITRRIEIVGTLENYTSYEENYDIVDHGIIIINNSKLDNNVLTVDTTGRTKATFSSYKDDGSFTLNYTTANAGTYYVVRSYVAYLDEAGSPVYCYSEPVMVSYNTL